MSKLIYKSEKPYTEDLNDLVEDELEKGRGPDKQPRKQRGSLSHIEDQDASDARRKEAKARVNAIVAARTAKMTDAQRAKMRKSDDEMDINDLVEQDMNHEETFYKGGVGSGQKGHRTMKDYNFHERMKTGGLDKKRGAMRHFKQQADRAKAQGDVEAHKHYSALHAEAAQHVMGVMKKSENEE